MNFQKKLFKLNLQTNTNAIKFTTFKQNQKIIRNRFLKKKLYMDTKSNLFNLSMSRSKETILVFKMFGKMFVGRGETYGAREAGLPDG